MEVRHPLCPREKGRIRDDEHPLVDARLDILLRPHLVTGCTPRQDMILLGLTSLIGMPIKGKYPPNSTKGSVSAAGSIMKR